MWAACVDGELTVGQGKEVYKNIIAVSRMRQRKVVNVVIAPGSIMSRWKMQERAPSTRAYFFYVTVCECM